MLNLLAGVYHYCDSARFVENDNMATKFPASYVKKIPVVDFEYWMSCACTCNFTFLALTVMKLQVAKINNFGSVCDLEK